jgi:Cys-tRNA(Pro)/Cys-tRNA(Cys) deacylase
MTPAINLLKKKKLPFHIHSYDHDEQHASYGIEAAQKLNVCAQQVFKTLVVELDNEQLAVAVIPVERQLSMKLMAKMLGAKKAMMADKQKVQRITGYVLGGVSPLGQKKRLKTLLDDSAQQYDAIYISAGKRGLEIELAAQTLIDLLAAQYAPLCAE